MAFPVEQTHIDYRLVTRSGLMIRVLTDFHLLWLLFSFFNINNFLIFFLGGGWGGGMGGGMRGTKKGGCHTQLV